MSHDHRRERIFQRKSDIALRGTAGEVRVAEDPACERAGAVCGFALSLAFDFLKDRQQILRGDARDRQLAQGGIQVLIE